MRWLKRVAISLLILIAVLWLAGYLALRASLPALDGEVTADAVRSATTIERDALGVPTITAANRLDLAFATGYAHGQDRFFQMDLQRRVASGELAALLGSELATLDKRFRRHDFRNVAKQVIAQSTSEQKQLIDIYVAGVNAGREAAGARSFEYLLLQTDPAPWLAEDCILVAFAMYIDLNDSLAAREIERARLHSVVPQSLFDVLYPKGTEWDATVDDMDLSNAHAPLPDAAAFDLSKQPKSQQSVGAPPEAEYPGSNNWAVSGTRTASGAALVANDMHLSFRLPHIWYRARLVVKTDNATDARDLAGVTLPGLPLLVAGSNGKIAWGFTNTHGNFDDAVIVDVDPENSNRYRNGDEFVEFKVRREKIAVRGGEIIEIEYRDTVWGPLLDETLEGKPLALAWTAQHPDATNLNQVALETATSVNEALEIANTAGIPVQNFVVGDTQGHIAWTPIGKLPKRSGFDGYLPVCWGCSKNVGWSGWIEPKDYPRVIDPPRGQLSTANSRTLGGAGAELIGDEDMDRGARTKQIRDGLLPLVKATPADMLKVHLDDRALFLARWRDMLVRLQDEAYLRGKPARREALKLVEAWTGRANPDDAGYRIVRTFRAVLQEDVYRDLTAAANAKFPDVKFRPSARFEDTLWRIVTTTPRNLLNPEFERWDLRVMASLDRAIEQMKTECGVSDKKLSECTWGRRNTLNMEHPLAGALPLFGRMLRMPHDQLPGDNDMPRVQGVAFGASERFAVSPGRESEGYFHMPGGQSGHPLSPYFGAGHEAWVKGEPTPFLPGEAQHRLTLSPARR